MRFNNLKKNYLKFIGVDIFNTKTNLFRKNYTSLYMLADFFFKVRSCADDLLVWLLMLELLYFVFESLVLFITYN